jgi:hypothetical protein
VTAVTPQVVSVTAPKTVTRRLRTIRLLALRVR